MSAFFLLLCAGLFLIGFGLYRFKGPVSLTYIAYGMADRMLNYFSIPGGIMSILWALTVSSTVPQNWKLAVLIVGLLVFFVGLLPARLLLNPTWLKWLEREHADIIPFLKVEIQEQGIRNLDSQINTQEELEGWVLTVRKKYKGIP